jgi:hypothetical protein
MLEKAEKNITKLFKVDDNKLKCTILVNYSHWESVVAIMELNGNRAEVKQEVLRTQEETINALMEKMAHKIAREMIIPALDEFMKHGIKI